MFYISILLTRGIVENKKFRDVQDTLNKRAQERKEKRMALEKKMKEQQELKKVVHTSHTSFTYPF